MSTTKLALITILEARDSGLKPDNTLPTPSPGRPDQGLPPAQGGHPSHPIVIPSPPNVIWPPTNPPGPDNTLPEPPPGFPVHLPVFPPVGPDNSLPGSQPKPDQGLPGSQPKPDQSLPGAQPKPDNSLPRPDQKFELKWTPVYGWVLVPCKDEVAEPKRR